MKRLSYRQFRCGQLIINQFLVWGISCMLFSLVWSVTGESANGDMILLVALYINVFSTAVFFSDMDPPANSATYRILTGWHLLQMVVFGWVVVLERPTLCLLALIPSALALVIACAFCVHSLIMDVQRAMKRRRLVREECRLRQKLSELEQTISYRWTPPNYTKLVDRMGKVRARIAELG